MQACPSFTFLRTGEAGARAASEATQASPSPTAPQSFTAVDGAVELASFSVAEANLHD